MVDVKCLSDAELQNELGKLGFSPGPILPSTRKVYEKKLVQLLVSTPCTLPVVNGPRDQDRAQDDDDSEELNATIILKGNIILSSEKNKRPQKTAKASTSNPKALDIICLDCKNSAGRRCPARVSVRFRERSNIREKAYCIIKRGAGNRNLETFPVGLKLAVFGIFIIVMLVYITVERKPLFG
ncbi:LEM domain-containing protein 1 [Camelus ferus]|uniref:LEM domain-containing protein 1 n=3 Tax=Camelus TaxID=9836 RepID=A0A8B8RXW5_CAMFR|nr:LEM domain-containing protein 1 [Camelus ferus]